MDQIASTWSPQDRTDLFREAAARLDVAPAIVEKDFWVCWVLKQLFAQPSLGYRLIFKGGTSLSKVFHAIDRFSEDVDLSLHREDLGFKDDRDPRNASSGKKIKELLESLSNRCTEVITNELPPQLSRRFETIIGPANTPPALWTLMPDATEKQSLLFAYPGSFTYDSPYLRPFVRLEFGARSDHWPAGTCSIQPYAAEAIKDSFTEPTCMVYTLEAKRTFWEKATLVHAEFHRPPTASIAERRARHYYDLAKLYESPVGRDALSDLALLREVVQHKQLFFRSGWASYETACPGTFHIVPSDERLPDLQKDYALVREHMIFGSSYTFDELLQVLHKLQDEINRLG